MLRRLQGVEKGRRAIAEAMDRYIAPCIICIYIIQGGNGNEKYFHQRHVNYITLPPDSRISGLLNASGDRINFALFYFFIITENLSETPFEKHP